MAILRVPLGFRSTPKRVSLDRRWNWLAPQIGTSLILLGAVIVGMSYPDTAHPGFLMVFAGLQAMPQLFLVWQAQRGSKNAASVGARIGRQFSSSARIVRRSIPRR
jgi:hypothetical protein